MTTTAPTHLRLLSGTCAPPLRAGMTAPDAQRQAAVFKALGDPTRLRLVSMVAAQDAGEACVCDLTEPLDLGQPTVSHHLKILVDAGVLVREKRGIWVYYSVAPTAFDEATSVLGSLAPSDS